MSLPKPINKTQTEFKRLCELGGGTKGGPARGRVQELLRSSGMELNKIACREITEHLAAFPERNPWHICFAMGLCWGHLAKVDLDFTDSATRVLEDLNERDLTAASKFHLDRGPEPIRQSLQGGSVLFSRVSLPPSLPDSLPGLHRAQESWLRPVANKSTRPRYIGNWNSTAMFMVALFSMPALARTLVNNDVLLPPGGPISAALSLLHQTHVASRPPAAKFDDGEVELGQIVEDNGLFAELRRGLDDWSLIDVHSGLYMLGTRWPQSNTWF